MKRPKLTDQERRQKAVIDLQRELEPSYIWIQLLKQTGVTLAILVIIYFTCRIIWGW